MMSWNSGLKHSVPFLIKNLIRKANEKAQQAPLREPDLMIILTAGKYAYKRQDGVYVIPVGLLGP